MRVHSRQTEHAFSLVEMVIVIVILGVIAAIAAPRYSAASERARLGQVAESARRIETALVLTLNEQGHQGLVEVDVLTTILDTWMDDDLLPYLRGWPVNLLIGPAAKRLGVSDGVEVAPLVNDPHEFGWLVIAENGEWRVGYFIDLLGHYRLPDDDPMQAPRGPVEVGGS